MYPFVLEDFMLRNNKNGNLWKFSKIAIINERNNFRIYSMEDSDRRPVSYRRPILKYMEFFHFLKSTSFDVTDVYFKWRHTRYGMFLRQWWRRDKTRFRSTSTLVDPNPNLNNNPNPNLHPNLNLSPKLIPNLNPNPNPNPKPNPFVVISAW
jgi:hypothetical protein